MLTPKFNVAKASFFDRKAVTDALDKASRAALSKFGSYVRTRARTSIEKRKRVSSWGKPPSSHTGLLRRFIYFGYDSASRSVVIGPVRLNGVGDPNELTALEEGGPSTAQDRKGGKRRKIEVRARPFMGPALAAEKPKLPGMWRDALGKAKGG